MSCGGGNRGKRREGSAETGMQNRAAHLQCVQLMGTVCSTALGWKLPPSPPFASSAGLLVLVCYGK